MKTTEEIKKIRSMSQDELVKELKSAQKKLSLESLKVQAGKSGNYSVISNTRKTVARIQTILNEKEVGE
ncbi:MAG: 50S ribosomal protein L29 [bacterium ADurb.Bin400]|nr:MAG: 50S ribosomal protein L29 [bacterium ADurb.Bin400]